jgi:hypothetical protein
MLIMYEMGMRILLFWQRGIEQNMCASVRMMVAAVMDFN